MNVRPLVAAGAAGLRARYPADLTAGDAAALAAASEARVLAVDVPVSTGAAALLRACGAVVVPAGARTLVAASRTALERAHGAADDDGERALVADLLAALTRSAQLAPVLRWRQRVVDVRDRAQVMGIVNVTPDSFYERVDGAEAAVSRARAMVDDGAALIDVGGQSYAAGLRRVSADEERARVVPAIRALVAAGIDAALSVDTFKAGVADAVLAAGAHAINDCSGLADASLPAVVAEHGAGLVVMHLKGRLNVREPEAYVYGDALAEIVEFLYQRTERALAAGVARDAIAIDPGLEFGKEPETDLEILQRFGELRALGYPIVLAASRKSFLARVTGRPAKELLVPSLAVAAVGIEAGARIVRAHDVAETVQLARMLAAVAPGARVRPDGTAAQGPGNSRPARAV